MKYNDKTSVCNKCLSRGWFEKPEKCTRTSFVGCKTCRSHENISTEKKCTGTNVMIDYSGIAKKFASYYGTNERIKVEFSHGEILTGTVGMTTGWKPVFLLIARSNSIGSSDILSDDDKII